VGVSTGQALLIFGGIPIGLAVIISIAIWAGSWSRPGSDDFDAAMGDVDAYGNSPSDVLFVVSAAGTPNPAHLPGELGMDAPVAGGGARGRW
jgi:hypothetical protein